MHDMAISLAYLSSALVLIWVAMREAARVPRAKALGEPRMSESDAHIFCCCSLATAYAFHALA